MLAPLLLGILAGCDDGDSSTKVLSIPNSVEVDYVAAAQQQMKRGNQDGAIDLAVGHLDHRFALLENQTQAKHPWIQLPLVATKSERNAVGARIEVVTNQGSFAQWVTSGDGYLCSDEPVIDFGLGAEAEIQHVVLHWPSGERQVFQDAAINQRYLWIENQDQVYPCW